MADFNVSLAAPQGAGSQALQPVQNAVTPSQNVWIAPVANLAGIFLKNQEEKKKADKEASEQSIVDSFTRDQTMLNDAIAQGTPLAQVKGRAAANFSKYAAAYPHLSEKFAKQNKDLFEYTDLKDAKDEAELFKDARKAMINDAIKGGAPIYQDTPPNVVDALVRSFQTSRKIETEFQTEVARNAEKRSANTAERAESEAILKSKSVTLLSSIGDAHLDSTFLNTQAIIAKTQKSGDIQGGLAELMQSYQGIERAIASVAAQNPSLAAPYQAMFADMKKFGMESIEGGKAATASENRLKEMQNRIQLMALATPENKALYGISKVLNGQLPASFFEANKAAQSSFVRLASEFGGTSVPNVVGDKQMEKLTIDMVGSQIDAIEAGKAPDPEASKVALGNLANNVLSQIGKAPSSGLTTEQLASTANFIASPQYVKLMEYGKISKEASEGAAKIFSMMYEKDVSEAVEKKLLEPFRTTRKGEKQPYGMLVDFKFSNGGVVAEETNLWKDKGIQLDMQENEKRRMFNREIGTTMTAMNRLIKAGAHLEGHTNYEKYWEENKHNILPSQYPDPNKLKVNQIVKGVNGKSYKYIGGNYNDIANSYVEVPDGKP